MLRMGMHTCRSSTVFKDWHIAQFPSYKYFTFQVIFFFFFFIFSASPPCMAACKGGRGRGVAQEHMRNGGGS